METRKRLFDGRVNVFLGDTATPCPPSIREPRRRFRSRRSSDGGANRIRRPSPPTGGLKPDEGGMRSTPPFGSPKREQQSQHTRRRTGGVASSQVDPLRGGTGAHVQRHGRWRVHSPLRLPGCMEDPASLASVPPPAARREVRLSGFPGALAEVRRRRIRGGPCRVPDAAPTGFSDARFVAKPAYPLGPHSVSPLRRLAGGCAPSDPRTGNGAP